MRNLLLLLVLANILYFLYGAIRGDDPKPGVDIVKESQLGPRIELAEARPTDGQEIELAANGDEPGVLTQLEDARQDDPGPADDEPVAAAETEGGGPALLTAIVGRSCVTVGPFRQREDAERAEMRYAGEGMRALVRSTTGQIFVGHWVQIRNIASREEANNMLKTLQQAGLGEAYLIASEDEGLKISIGLFGEASGAERVELQVNSLGLNAVIVPRMTEGTVHYVDMGLPPGRGAGSIIEQYGEDKVLLREAATCPGDA